MSAIENEPAAATAEGAEAPDSSGSTATPGCERTPPDNGDPETNSSPARKRRPAPYTRSFRPGFPPGGRKRSQSKPCGSRRSLSVTYDEIDTNEATMINCFRVSKLCGF